jgi:hypothetical protein
MLRTVVVSALSLGVGYVGTVAAAPAAPRVFAGAQGFGVETPAGRGGAIVRVTTLDADGRGSLRAALETKGPRIIVFEVGGVIDLNKKDLVLSEPFVTIAGQTAPSPGITIIRGGLQIKTHDVLMQHIRIRPGDAGAPKQSGWEPEVTALGADAFNIVIDHCSFSWAIDENLSASGPRYDGPAATAHNLTFSHNIIAEGLSDSSHSKGPHSMGTLVHDNCTNIAVIGNLYAHNNQRNPYFKANTTGVIVNNLIYNPGTRAIAVDWPVFEWEGRPLPGNARVSIVGNRLIHGVSTRKGLGLVGPKGDCYLEDNLSEAADRRAMPVTYGDVNVLDEKPVWPEGLSPLPALKVSEWIVAHAGARPKDRDSVDGRIIRELQERRGRIINSQDEVGGYPSTPATQRKLKLPKSGIDEWLAKLAAELE